MGKYRTSSPISVTKLTAELGDRDGVVVREFPVDGETEVEIEDLTDEEIADAVNNHVFDADFGRPPNERFLRNLRDKCIAVARGDDTFTVAQMNRLIAILALRELNEE